MLHTLGAAADQRLVKRGKSLQLERTSDVPPSSRDRLLVHQNEMERTHHYSR